MGVVEAAPTMLGLFSTRPEAPIAAYAAGPEVGSYQSLAVDRPPILVEVMGARYNKYVRAKRTAARWKVGRVRVPTGRPWGPAFVRSVKSFTGADGGQDDEVDAFVAAHDRLMLGADGAHSETPWTAGKRRM